MNHRTLVILLVSLCMVLLHPDSAQAKRHSKTKDKQVEAPLEPAKKMGPQAVDVDVSGFFGKAEKKAVRHRKISRPSEPATVEIDEDTPEKLFEQINRARLALIQNNFASALNHTAQAQDTLGSLDNDGNGHASEYVHIGHFIFYHGKHIAYSYYFPMNSELAEWSGPEDTPFWSQDGGIAIKDVSLTSINLDINIATTRDRLEKLRGALEGFKYDEAHKYLAELIDGMMTLKNTQKMPLTKARDNVQLTRYFIESGSYDAARHALHHARDGLREVEKDARYLSNKKDIEAMEKDLVKMSKDLVSKDPSFLGQTEVTLENWWYNLTDISLLQDTGSTDSSD